MLKRKNKGITILETQIMSLLFAVALLGYLKVHINFKHNQIKQIQQLYVLQSSQNIIQTIKSIPTTELNNFSNLTVNNPTCSKQYQCITEYQSGGIVNANQCSINQWVQFQIDRQVCTLNELGVQVSSITISCLGNCLADYIDYELSYTGTNKQPLSLKFRF